ncbi:DUF1214 domain-containing protein [Tropicimonas sp. TH_r6]|uniref:DUF1254 domain-containing protein n=1 Tax=Tropicimonas sp. TH_r6 TaxID=3082085 RepID=UPI002954BEA1|nr:DUF1214 domain-containing protein [Tropicimonas sp. TH_r6]MDV7145805.1 DUF1214 domain-containing protein [Tropicimonas sp. TH_r6]
MRKRYLTAILASTALCAFVPAAHANDRAVLTQSQAEELARDAYIFGAAFVSNYRVFISLLLEGSPLMQGAGFNEFAHNREPFPPETADTTQRDTLFSLGIIDLRREPIVITVPDVPDGESYMLQMGDTSTETLPYISTLTTDNKAGDYVLVGPEYQGLLPADRFDGVITTRGQFIVMLGRTTLNDPNDLSAPHAIQDGMQMRPLSAILSTTPPPEVPEFDFLPWDAEKANGIGVFDYINMALAWHPPAISELPLMARFSKLGVVPGEPFPAEDYSPEIVAAIEDVIAEVNEAFEESTTSMGAMSGNWRWDVSDVSRFGTDYYRRSATAHKTIYPNAPDHAVYGQTYLDSEGNQLTGASGATLRFEAESFPPTQDFWSLTLYDAETTAMYPNPAERYKVGSKTEGLSFAEDGSLTLSIQHEEPTDPEQRSNWLPAPEGDIYLVLRLYGAEPEVLEGNWAPPPIMRR